MTHAQTGFWSWQLLLAMALNGVVQCVTVSAYASRLAGARSGRVATAISLYNLFMTAGRFASMVYTPILGSLADKAGLPAARMTAPEAIAALSSFQWQLRWIVFAGTIGVAAGGLLLPTFVMIYLRGIAAFERLGSVPHAMLRLFNPATLLRVLAAVRFARVASLITLSWKRMPKDVLILNTVVTSVYGIGIVSAAFASVLDPATARTALLSSGLINGGATIAYNVIVDPKSAYITDQAARGERPIDDIRSLVAYLAMTAILGFLISQLLLIPAAFVIDKAAHVIAGH